MSTTLYVTPSSTLAEYDFLSAAITTSGTYSVSASVKNDTPSCDTSYSSAIPVILPVTVLVESFMIVISAVTWLEASLLIFTDVMSLVII